MLSKNITYNFIRRYRVVPKWLEENIVNVPAGKGPLRLCWWRGNVSYVVNLKTQHYRQLSNNSYILANEENIPFHTTLRCKRNGVSGCITVHYTDNTNQEGILKIDEELNIRVLRK